MRSLRAQRKARGRTGRPAKTAREPGRTSRDGSARQTKASGRLSAAARRSRAFVRHPRIALCALLGLLLLLGALVASGMIGRGLNLARRGIDGVATDAGFAISEIHISGNRRTPYRQILQVLGMQPGQSMLDADLWKARAKLSSLEWIASAEIHRRYPDAIFVTLVEKRPFALWQAPPDAHGESMIYVVERSGKPITTQDVDKFSRLPKLAGAGAPETAAELVDAVGSHRAVAARVAAYVRISDRRWNLLLDDGVTVELPEIGWRKELDTLEHLIIDDAILERDVSEIDLRSPTHYFFLLRSGEKKDMRGKET